MIYIIAHALSFSKKASFFFFILLVYTFVLMEKMKSLYFVGETSHELIGNDVKGVKSAGNNLEIKNNSPGSLQFVHISKTAGTAIEQHAYLSGINWGSCYWKKTHMCEGRYKKREFDYDENEIPFKFKGVPWHTPPHWLNPNPFKGSKTFTVVRNPYDRILSEYYCNFMGYKGPNQGDTKVMNDWVQKKLEPQDIVKPHFLPQHYYIYNKKGEKVIDYIIKYENLETELHELMEKFSLNVTLAKHANAAKVKKKLTKEDFTKDTVKKINQYYADDFKHLDYAMM